MREFWEVYPIILPSPQIEVRWELKRAWEAEEHEELPKIWQDHINSVRDFKVWKAEHPHDGTMTSLYHWSPYIVAGLGVIACLSGSPLGIFAITGSLKKILDKKSGVLNA